MGSCGKFALRRDRWHRLVARQHSCAVPPKRVLLLVAISCPALWVLMILVLVGASALAGLAPIESQTTNYEPDRRLMAVAGTHLSECFLAALAPGVLAFRMVLLPRRESASRSYCIGSNECRDLTLGAQDDRPARLRW